MEGAAAPIIRDAERALEASGRAAGEAAKLGGRAGDPADDQPHPTFSLCHLANSPVYIVDCRMVCLARVQIAASAKTVAVLGCKTENQASQPAFYVPEALQGMGVKVVPVLVYYPDVITVLGEQVVRDLRQIKEQASADLAMALTGYRGRMQPHAAPHLPRAGHRTLALNLPSAAQVDILDVFRRPQDLPGHVDDILAMDPRPACVWLQSGISNAEVEQRLAEEGIPVVVSRCLMVDRRAAQGRRSSL
eukprot:scaffold15.g4315.t1